MAKTGIGSHTKPNQGTTNTWLTPPALIDALGPFDLDPCAAPSPRPWLTAARHIELPEDGLAASWSAPRCTACEKLSDPKNLCLVTPYRCFINPPYGKEVDAWLDKLSTHGSGLALIFARTETATWHRYIWPRAHSIFFFNGRLWFHHPDGKRGSSNAGGPSALVSYSVPDTECLMKAWENGLIKGILVRDWVGRGQWNA